MIEGGLANSSLRNCLSSRPIDGTISAPVSTTSAKSSTPRQSHVRAVRELATRPLWLGGAYSFASIPLLIDHLRGRDKRRGELAERAELDRAAEHAS